MNTSVFSIIGKPHENFFKRLKEILLNLPLELGVHKGVSSDTPSHFLELDEEMVKHYSLTAEGK